MGGNSVLSQDLNLQPVDYFSQVISKQNVIMGVTLSRALVDKALEYELHGMGILLAIVISESGEDNRLTNGISSMQGWRVTMEDARAAVLNLQNWDDPTKAGSEGRISCFGVYMVTVETWLRSSAEKMFTRYWPKQPAFKDSNYKQALEDGFGGWVFICR
ncbi:hypothetical protein HOY82DRAFT_641485 [Tuber indicum]|nr:hypothetical protein HOY82DRAFT_641485 [Tuber indicum]